MEIFHLSHLDEADRATRAERVRLGVALVFMVAVLLQALVWGEGADIHLLLIGTVLAAYLAMNIGANDIANNVGPAVGARAMSLTLALGIGLVCEVAGALLAGEQVVATIRGQLFDPSQLSSPQVHVWVMIAALLAAALWINIATAMGAPVSTTHAVVAAVLGAAVAAAGPSITNWQLVGSIAIGWVATPLLSGLIAAAFLLLTKRTIIYHPDMIAAARRMVPLLLALMAAAFCAFMLHKALHLSGRIGVPILSAISLACGLLILLIARPLIARASQGVGNTKQSVNRLFNWPLIVAAGLLSFAHGANDVANAVAPLVAIAEVVATGVVAARPLVPFWAMVVGALGIAVGLALYGPRVIRTVGSEITELDQMRAYCIAMSAALTVLLASALGLPVSSTHIVVGAVFGIGLLREQLQHDFDAMVEQIKASHPQDEQVLLDRFLSRFEKASLEVKADLLRELKEKAREGKERPVLSKQERKALKRLYREQLVQRAQLIRIGMAWLVTVPLCAALSAALFYMIRGMAIA